MIDPAHRDMSFPSKGVLSENLGDIYRYLQQDSLRETGGTRIGRNTGRTPAEDKIKISFFRSSLPGGRTTVPAIVFPGSAVNNERGNPDFATRPAVSRETAREPLPIATRRQHIRRGIFRNPEDSVRIDIVIARREVLKRVYAAEGREGGGEAAESCPGSHTSNRASYGNPV
jgi:hypothetical protein